MSHFTNQLFVLLYFFSFGYVISFLYSQLYLLIKDLKSNTLIIFSNLLFWLLIIILIIISYKKIIYIETQYYYSIIFLFGFFSQKYLFTNKK